MAKENAAQQWIGQQVGGCRLIRLLGTGGMGSVFLAEQTALGKEVAVKILDQRYASQPRHVEGFLREARLAARLEDEHIVQIFDVGTDGPYHYIVMQYARGESLRDRLKRGALEIEEALRYIEGVARGLSVAHGRNIIHRDIKPANLVIGEDGVIKILDFGLAHLEQGDSDRSQGQFMGSLAYMAPEQSEYLPIDARTDIYSLGVTAFQCFTGQLPFRGDSNHDLILRHHGELPVAPSLLRPEVPLTVSRVVLRMLAKDARQRYQSVDDLLVDLKLIRRHQLVAAPWPWGARPLNPPGLDLSGVSSEQVYLEALKIQRAQVTDGKPVTPLRELLSGFGVMSRPAAEAILPDRFLEVRFGEARATLEDAAGAGFAPRGGTPAVFAERFSLEPGPKRLVLKVRGARPLSVGDVQRLFDLLEAMPGFTRQFAVALEPEYHAQGSDIRWVVDVYNLLDRRGCAFALILGSMENHTTFVNLGVDSHIKLELELGRAAPFSVETGGTETEGELLPATPLTPAARALVSRIEELAASGDAAGAARTWRRLLSEGLDRRQTAELAGLRGRLYERLLAEGREAFEQDDLETATERFNLLIDLEPGRYEGHFYKGLLMKAEGKLEYAQAFLTQAILAAPDDGELFYHRAIVRSRSDDLEGALRDLSMALQHNPRLAAAYYNRARLHQRMGREDLARRDLRLYQRLKGGVSARLPEPGSPTPTAEQKA
jgi:hypothetical protein